MTREHTFREGLYYRLSVFPIQVPPLRERIADIPLLASHFVDEVANRMGKSIATLWSRSLERLLSHHWPGTSVKLQNVIERAVILARDASLDIPELGESSVRCDSSLTPELESHAASPGASSQGLAEAGKAHILRVLSETNWVIAGPRGAAARLQIKRTALNFRMKKLGIARRTEDSSS